MNHYFGISQFQIGHQTTTKDFVARNRTMALISDVTIIVEAGELSGSRHQGWLKDEYPNAHIRAFAAIRALSPPDFFSRIYDPRDGTITLSDQDTYRRP